MKWYNKAIIAKCCSLLPKPWDYSIYFCMQKRFGFFSNYHPNKKFSDTFYLLDEINKTTAILSKTILELGTGWDIIAPICFWLYGAGKIITVDLNNYLSEELTKKTLLYIKNNISDFEKRPDIVLDRLHLLSECDNLSDVFSKTSISYIPECDARNLTNYVECSIDIFFSNNVFEHINKDTLSLILKEFQHYSNKDTIQFHLIDLSDHFSHSDPSIDEIHFLKYSGKFWSFISGNQFRYCNRLRKSEYLSLFSFLKYDVSFIYEHTIANRKTKTLHPDYSAFSQDDINTINMFVVLKQLAKN